MNGLTVSHTSHILETHPAHVITPNVDTRDYHGITCQEDSHPSPHGNFSRTGTLERKKEVGFLVNPTEHRENATKTVEKSFELQPSSDTTPKYPARRWTLPGPGAGAHRSLCGFLTFLGTRAHIPMVSLSMVVVFGTKW